MNRKKENRTDFPFQDIGPGVPELFQSAWDDEETRLPRPLQTDLPQVRRGGQGERKVHLPSLARPA